MGLKIASLSKHMLQYLGCYLGSLSSKGKQKKNYKQVKTYLHYIFLMTI